MKRLFCLMIILTTYTANAQEAKLCHIAGAGFYATDGEKGVLLDALFRDGLAGFEEASDITNDKMENAEGMFADVKVIFASHFHGDHMTGKAMVTHLQNNEDAVAIITDQAKHIITAGGSVKNADVRIKSFKLPIGENLELENMPFPIKLYGISHGEGRPIENIGMAITVAGKTIMHVGDMSAKKEDLLKAEVGKANIDYLLLPFWYANSQETMSEINDVFKPKSIIPMHFAPPFGVMWDGIKETEELKKRVYSSAFNLIKLEEEMTCISLE